MTLVELRGVPPDPRILGILNLFMVALLRSGRCMLFMVGLDLALRLASGQPE